jgi:hypothetical protein
VVFDRSGLFGPSDPDALGLLQSYGAVTVPLRTNCRNTSQILQRVRADLGADMGVTGTGDGPEVRFCQTASPAAAVRALADELHYLRDRGGLQPQDITILSPQPFTASIAGHLPAELRAEICVLDEYAMRSFPPAAVSFAEIAAFKGLENEAVIVVDPPAAAAGPEATARAYVAMSRARALLSLIYH